MPNIHDKLNLSIAPPLNSVSLSAVPFFEAEMEAMEITNPFGVLAESQENGLQAHMNLTQPTGQG
ncbi:hypothetical protein LAZ67_15001020 [Cordylochernes scorpioides]|uniref:Uncharacterized protein n=1 Tax=Cordylochernes scorpioides TaxID=51811 RepID=A0ABY6LCL1_9ARAC|nr:hypothetical protein LAZ67_15001020 [Cordylochernes scorpioides]